MPGHAPEIPEFEKRIRRIAEIGSRLSLLATGVSLNLPNVDEKARSRIVEQAAYIIEHPGLRDLVELLARAGTMRPKAADPADADHRH